MKAGATLCRACEVLGALNLTRLELNLIFAYADKVKNNQYDQTIPQGLLGAQNLNVDPGQQLAKGLLLHKEMDRQIAMANRLAKKGTTKPIGEPVHAAAASGVARLINVYMGALTPRCEGAKFLGVANGHFPDDLGFTGKFE